MPKTKNFSVNFVKYSEMNQRTAIFLLLLLSHTCLQAETITGRVIKVTDGDTVDILDADHIKHHVRMAGIDAPESKQPFGTRAQQKLSALAFGQQVRFEWSKLDHRKRPVGILLVSPPGCEMCDQTVDAGFEVLKAGLAWHYKQYQREQTSEDRLRYSQGETDARAQQIGLWADPDPIAPWEWRKATKLKYQQAKLRNLD